MSRLVDLGKVVLFGPRGVPNLDEKRFCQVNEFVKVVVGKKIRVRGLKVFIANPVLRNNLFSATQLSHLKFFEHLISRPRVLVNILVAHNLAYILAGIGEDDVVSSGVVIEERGKVVDFAVVSAER